MDSLERIVRAEFAAFRLLGLPDTATKEEIQTRWKQLVVENRRQGGSDQRWRDLNAARDAALGAVKRRREMSTLRESVAAAMHDVVEDMEQAFAPLRRQREREQERKREHARAKEWMDWAMPRQNGRRPYPMSQGWFDFSTKPGMDLIKVGYATTDETARKEMQVRLDLIQKLNRQERARANRARRKHA